jgi:hypothetical protein
MPDSSQTMQMQNYSTIHHHIRSIGKMASIDSFVRLQNHNYSMFESGSGEKPSVQTVFANPDFAEAVDDCFNCPRERFSEVAVRRKLLEISFNGNEKPPLSMEFSFTSACHDAILIDQLRSPKDRRSPASPRDCHPSVGKYFHFVLTLRHNILPTLMESSYVEYANTPQVVREDDALSCDGDKSRDRQMSEL